MLIISWLACLFGSEEATKQELIKTKGDVQAAKALYAALLEQHVNQ